MTGGEEALKSDKLGRVRRPRGKREEILDAFERSGVSGVEFARMVGIKYPTLASWIQRRGRTKTTPQIRFLEAEMPQALPAIPPLDLELPGGVRLRLMSPAQIPLVAQLLRSLGPC